MRMVVELLDVAVERPVLEQLEVEIGAASEDRVRPGPAFDHGEDRYLDAVDQSGGHQRPVQRQAAVRAQRHPDSLLSRATVSTRGCRECRPPSSGDHPILMDQAAQTIGSS